MLFAFSGTVDLGGTTAGRGAARGGCGRLGEDGGLGRLGETATAGTGAFGLGTSSSSHPLSSPSEPASDTSFSLILGYLCV
jgi:hypothetical protein